MSAPTLAAPTVRYSQQYRRCGRPGCPTCTPPARGHGPYWYAYWWEGGRVRSRYLGKQPPAWRCASAAPAPDGALRIRTLGGFAVWQAGALVPASKWGRKKVAALFKCLLSAPDHRLHREQLLDLLYPETGPTEAAKGLRSTVYLLRKLIDAPDAPASHLYSEGDLLTLRPVPAGEPDPDWLDATAFLRAAAAALARSDPADCRTALALYGGEYLPEDRYEPWAERWREELRGQHLAVLLCLADLSRAAAEPEEARRCLRMVLTEDPCHEDAAQALMVLLAGEGRRSEALEVYRALASALDADLGEAPGRETRALRARLLAEAPVTVVPPAKRTNLPAPLTSFVGREWECREVGELLRPGGAGSRLVTLVGAGGCGKTRLAIEVGRTRLDDFPDGVFLVELAPLSDPELLPRTVAGALGLAETLRLRALEQLTSYLGPKRVLLVLDNCEHLLAPCAALAAALLRAAPDVRLLVTSQAMLGVLGEQVWRVPSLALPEHDDLPAAELAAFEAVQLFLERAQAVQPRFVLTERNAAAVVEICRRLDGIPLAVELAAARLASLSVEQIAARLDDRLALLSAGNRTALPRQQTLRATIAWSVALLSSAEQLLLQRLAVFVGGWTLAAAEAICSGQGLAQRAVLQRLDGLVAKSLVQVEDAGAELRYRLLETVRIYALEQLEAAGEMEHVRARHLAWYLTLAEEAEPQLTGPEQATWLARVATEHDNLRAARDEARQPGREMLGLRLAGALQRFWNVRGHLGEGRSWLAEALAVGGRGSRGSTRQGTGRGRRTGRSSGPVRRGVGIP